MITILILYWFITTTFAIGMDIASYQAKNEKCPFKDYVLNVLIAWLLLPLYLGMEYVDSNEEIRKKLKDIRENL